MGSFNFSLEAEPREVKTGDPITLKMTITGSGNFNSVNPPEFKPGDNFKVYEPDIRQAQASKTFEQVIIPKNENITEIPEVSFSFFDVTTGEYKTLTKGPIPIKVNPLPKGEELKIFDTKEDEAGLISKKEVLGRDIIYIKDSPGNFEKRGMFLCKNRLFMAIQFFPLLLIILIWVLQRRKERLATDIRYARSLMASPKAKKNLKLAYRSLNLRETTKFFDTVFKTLQEYLGDKFHLPSAGITVNIVEELKSYKINPDTLVKIKQCFNRCDTARYASGNITKDEMQKTFDILEEIIDELEKIKL
jgi:hypothetical protein